jgi:hypothetical protein
LAVRDRPRRVPSLEQKANVRHHSNGGLESRSRPSSQPSNLYTDAMRVRLLASADFSHDVNEFTLRALHRGYKAPEN